MECISRTINVTVNLLWKETVSLIFCFSSSCLFGWLFVAVLPRMETSNLVASSASLRCGSTVPVNIMESFWSLIYSNMIMSGQVSEALQFGCKRVKSPPCKMLWACTASNNNCRPTWTFPGTCTSDCKNTCLPTAKSKALSPKPCCGTAEGQGQKREFFKNGI